MAPARDDTAATPIEGEVLEPEATLDRWRRPDVPVTLNDLAATKAESVEIIQARIAVLETLRKASIRMTHPEDWLLFKSPDEQGGQITGYLQDCGCDRVRDLYGIEIFGIGKPERMPGDEGSFHYFIRGSARCRLTLQTVTEMEGGRASTDDFVRGKRGNDLELMVRKAARANLDGNLVRELTGLKNVPLEEIKAAWSGTTKTVDRCRRGRGFGSHDERLGATREGTPDVDPPVCPHCKSRGAYRPATGTRGAFYGCPNYQKHQDKKWIVDAAKWHAEQQAKSASESVPGDEAPPPTFER